MKKSGGTTNKWLTIFALVFYAHVSSICASIRYGFLADAFARKNVPGKVYGMIGTSMFVGFGLTYIFQVSENLMRKCNSKTIMITNMLCWAIVALITGFSYHISNTTVVVVISFAMRIFQGFLSYPSSLVPVDFINANFPDEFDMVNGVLNMGYFSGHGIAEVLGSMIYDKLGYEYAYSFSAIMALLAATVAFFFLPNTKTYLSMQDDISDDDESMKYVNSEKRKLTKFLIFPLGATMLINANYGVIQVSVTPFLKEQFQKSISYGGLVLTLVSVGMALGSVVVGLLLQKKVLNHFTTMALGASFVFTGLLVTFPPESLPTIYNLAPIIAFPGVFMAGVGDPLMTIATLRALYDLQLQKKGVLTPKLATKITGIWLMGYCSMYYSGSFIAGTLADYFTYSTTAQILAVFCLLAVLVCVVMRLNFKKNADVDEEKEALLQKEDESN